MYWSRVKTILIIMFLCINVFLLVNMMNKLNQTITIKPGTIDDTVDIMKRNNVDIDKKIIPAKVGSMARLVLKNPEQDSDAFATKVLGTQFEKQPADDSVKYVSGSRTFIIQGCKFQYTDTSPNEGIALSEASAGNDARKMLEKYKIDMKNAYLDKAEKLENSTYSVRFLEKYKGKDIYGCYITVVLTPKGVVNMDGYWVTSPGVASERWPTRHVTGVLVDFISNKDRDPNQQTTITNIEIGYHLDAESTNTKDIGAAPVWKITAKTQDGNQKDFYYSTIDGEEIKN